MKKFILVCLLSFLVTTNAEISRALCKLPHEKGSVSHVRNLNLTDISGTWYVALMDKDVLKNYIP